MMKKTLALFLTTTLLSTAALATNAKKVANPSTPRLYLSVIDVSASKPVDLQKTEISRSAKQQLCWSATGGIFPTPSEVTEVFTSPKPTTFQAGDSFSMSSADKKVHTITSKKTPSNDNKVVSGCWQFDKTDPTGQYSLSVKIGNIQYGQLNFKVTE